MMAEETLDAATLAALPSDAPVGHRAHEKVKLNGRRCYIQLNKIMCQTTIGECGSATATLRIARAMWVKLDDGASKEEVIKFRAECLEKLRAVSAPASAVKRERELDEDAVRMVSKGYSGASPSSSSKRARGLGASPQASSCGRHSSSSSTLSPVKAPPTVSFSAGLRTLRCSLEDQGIKTKGSWSELVSSIELAEEAKVASNCSSATGSVSAPASAAASVSEEPSAASAAATAAAGASAPTVRASPKALATVRSPLQLPRALAIKKKLCSKRPPATPQRRASLEGVRGGAVRVGA
mmetsp:Transcript_103221/g.296241  ORF Transcript_103221/g.296241 Transcript_103221/m.296241 type:complete len:296 (-) Transcript_103221:100-987(-)